MVSDALCWASQLQKVIFSINQKRTRVNYFPAFQLIQAYLNVSLWVCVCVHVVQLLLLRLTLAARFLSSLHVLYNLVLSGPCIFLNKTFM